MRAVGQGSLTVLSSAPCDGSAVSNAAAPLLESQVPPGDRGQDRRRGAALRPLTAGAAPAGRCLGRVPVYATDLRRELDRRRGLRGGPRPSLRGRIVGVRLRFASVAALVWLLHAHDEALGVTRARSRVPATR